MVVCCLAGEKEMKVGWLKSGGGVVVGFKSDLVLEDEEDVVSQLVVFCKCFVTLEIKF